MNLFVSFMLRAISVFIKDWILYAEQDSNHCFISTVSELSQSGRVLHIQDSLPCDTQPPGVSCRLRHRTQQTVVSRNDH